MNLATVLLCSLVLIGCGGSSDEPRDMTVAPDLTFVSPCGATGPYGDYTSVNGGQSGVTACGHSFSSFSGATMSIKHATSGTGALLTVTGTGTIGDVVDCPAVVTECNVGATACTTGASSTISYTLMTYTHQVTGTVSPSIPGAGGGCVFTYSIDGQR